MQLTAVPLSLQARHAGCTHLTASPEAATDCASGREPHPSARLRRRAISFRLTRAGETVCLARLSLVQAVGRCRITLELSRQRDARAMLASQRRQISLDALRPDTTDGQCTPPTHATQAQGCSERGAVVGRLQRLVRQHFPDADLTAPVFQLLRSPSSLQSLCDARSCSWSLRGRSFQS